MGYIKKSSALIKRKTFLVQAAAITAATFLLVVFRNKIPKISAPVLNFKRIKRKRAIPEIKESRSYFGVNTTKKGPVIYFFYYNEKLAKIVCPALKAIPPKHFDGFIKKLKRIEIKEAIELLGKSTTKILHPLWVVEKQWKQQDTLQDVTYQQLVLAVLQKNTDLGYQSKARMINFYLKSFGRWTMGKYITGSKEPSSANIETVKEAVKKERVALTNKYGVFDSRTGGAMSKI
ncbi:MAG: hypothetical protein JWP81_2831 [Ferruginibacter sp.]|nr:hypothetical protein [Ferruginibacter sp.]